MHVNMKQVQPIHGSAHGAPLLPARACFHGQQHQQQSTRQLTLQGCRCCSAPEAQSIVDLALSGQQVGTAAAVLKPTLTIVEIFFIVRIVMSWDPQYDTDKKLPWAIFYKPTEPVLGPTRRVIKPIGGVDISPIVWVFLISLSQEILLGPQGLLVLIERQGGI